MSFNEKGYLQDNNTIHAKKSFLEKTHDFS